MSSKKTSKAKSKKEEALAFLDDLDNFTPPPSTAAVVSTNTITPGLPTSTTATPRASSSLDRPPSASVDAPRASTDSVRRPATTTVETEDPNEALAFLEAQIAQKRPIRSATPVNNKPAPSGPILPAPTAPTRPLAESARLPAANVPTSVPAPSGGGWGTSFWSSASAAVAKARTVADEGYKMVKEQAEKVQENAGVHGGEGERGIGGINLGRLGIAEGLGQLSQLGAGVVRGVDLEKLRADILSRGQSAITDLINTVAPPISEHETLQVWLAHEMVGYDGVTGVVESGVARILEQTSSEDLEVIFLPTPKEAPATKEEPASGSPGKEEKTTSPRSSLDPSSFLASATALASQFQNRAYAEDEERTINPVQGWEEGWKKAETGVKELVERAKVDSRRRGPDPSLPVTTIPLYIHIQPVLVPLAFSEPPISTSVHRDSVSSPTESLSRSLNPASASTTTTSDSKPEHLTFILSLSDTTHSLRFITVTQYSPADWLEVEYDRSDWVEERLVAVLKTGIEGLLQEYVATRMGLKRASYNPSAAVLHTPTSTNRSSADGAAPSATDAENTATDPKVPNETAGTESG